MLVFPSRQSYQTFVSACSTSFFKVLVVSRNEMWISPDSNRDEAQVRH